MSACKDCAGSGLMRGPLWLSWCECPAGRAAWDIALAVALEQVTA